MMSLANSFFTPSTDFLSTSHLETHVSWVSQSWTSFLFQTAPCRKATSLPFQLCLQICWRCSWRHSSSGTLRQLSITQRQCIPFKAGVESLPPPLGRMRHLAQCFSSTIYQATVVGAHERGSCPLKEPCTEGQLILYPGQSSITQPLSFFPSPFPLWKTLSKQRGK